MLFAEKPEYYCQVTNAIKNFPCIISTKVVGYLFHTEEAKVLETDYFAYCLVSGISKMLHKWSDSRDKDDTCNLTNLENIG